MNTIYTYQIYCNVTSSLRLVYGPSNVGRKAFCPFILCESLCNDVNMCCNQTLLSQIFYGCFGLFKFYVGSLLHYEMNTRKYATIRWPTLALAYGFAIKRFHSLQAKWRFEWWKRFEIKTDIYLAFA